MAPHQSEGISGNGIQFLMSIFPITIGVFVGVLGGAGLSYMADRAKVSTPPQPARHERLSIPHADTTGIRNHPVDPPAPNQRKRIP
jgi:hypothetical protein